MEKTYERVPFGYKTIKGYDGYDKVGFVLALKAKTEEEKKVARDDGMVNHVYIMDRKAGIGKRLVEDSNCPYYYWVYNGKDPVLKQYFVDIDEIEGTLVLRVYVFYVKIVNGPETESLDFMEITRFCFKGTECWVEHRNGAVVEHGIGTVLTKKSFFYNILCNCYPCNTDNAESILRKTYPQCTWLWLSSENGGIHPVITGSFLLPINLIRNFMSMRRGEKIGKEVPAIVRNDLCNLDREIQRIVSERGTNKVDFCYSYVLQDMGLFLRIFKLLFSTNSVEKAEFLCKDVVYVAEGKVYLFEKNFFEGRWASSYKRKVVNEFLYMKGSAYLNTTNNYDEQSFSLMYSPSAACKELLKKHFGLNWIDYDLVDFPIAVSNLASANLSAEQALKMGFYELFLNQFTGRHNGSPYPLFNRYKDKNFSEIFAEGSFGRKLMKVARRYEGKLSYSKLEAINHVFRATDGDMFRLREYFKDSEDIIMFFIMESWSRYDMYGYLGMLADVCCICDVFERNGKDHVAFFRALIKYHSKMGSVIAQETPFVEGEVSEHDAHYNILRYRDYLNMIDVAQKYSDKKGLGETFKEILKPSNIKWSHDHALEYYNFGMRELELESDHEMKERFIRETQTEAYTSLERKDDEEEYEVIIPSKAEDLFKEGEKLHHCVAGYWKEVARGNTKIFFVRKKGALHVPFFTGEVKHFDLRQFFGAYNSTNKDMGLRSFIKKWAKDRHIHISCKV